MLRQCECAATKYARGLRENGTSGNQLMVSGVRLVGVKAFEQVRLRDVEVNYGLNVLDLGRSAMLLRFEEVTVLQSERALRVYLDHLACKRLLRSYRETRKRSVRSAHGLCVLPPHGRADKAFRDLSPKEGSARVRLLLLVRPRAVTTPSIADATGTLPCGSRVAVSIETNSGITLGTFWAISR